MTQKLSTDAFERLRRKAEALLKERGIEEPDSDQDDLIRLTQELEVHYIELELQNEELLKAKAEVEQARNEYADLYESAPVAYLTMDKKGVIQRVNKAALRLFKGSEAYLVGSMFLPWLEAESVSQFNAFMRRLTPGPIGGPFDLTLRTKTGEKIYVQTAVTGKEEREGKEEFYRLALMDMTELKQREKALRERERRERELTSEMEAVLDLVPVPVFIVHDPDSYHITGNYAAAALLRQPYGAESSLSAPDKVRPHHFRAIKDGRELALDELPAQRAARGVQVRDFDFSLVFDDGSSRHVVGHGTPLIDEQGRPRGAIHVLVDITERKRMEEALRQSRDELEMRVRERTADLVQAKRMLETEVSERRRAEAILKAHEEELEKLNEALHLEIEKRKHFEIALKSSTEKIIQEHNQRKALSGQLVELLEKDRREVAMALHDHAGQILTALKMDLEAAEKNASQGDGRRRLESAKDKAMDLLAFIKDTSMQLRPSTLDTLGLAASVRNLIDNLPTLSREKIHFHEGDLPQRLGQDVEIALYRIIQESVNNAIKYAHAEHIHINLIRKGEKVLLLSIEDDGRGFDQNHESPINPQTTHLGLTIMQERAVLLGGSFEIDSSPGNGTVVMVEIPFGENPKSEARNPKQI